MPKIPVYRRTETRDPLPGTQSNVRATGAAFGGVEGKELQQLGRAGQVFARGVGHLAIKLRNERDTADVRDAYDTSGREILETVNPLFGKRGKDAMNIYGEGNDAMEKIRRRGAKGLKSQRQRDLFNRYLGRDIKHNRTSLIRKQAQETTVYDNETLDAENLLIVDNAIFNRRNPNYIAASELKIRKNTAQRYKGFEGAVIDKAVDDGVNNLYLAVTNGYLAESPSAAFKYLKANQDKFNSDTYARLHPILEQKAEEDVIRIKAIDIATSGLPLQDQLDAADKIADTSVSKAVRAQVKQRYSDRQNAKTAAQKEYYDGEWNALVLNPATYEIPYANLKNPEWQAMELYRSNILKQNAGFRDTTDMNLWANLSVLPASELAKIPITQMVGYMDRMEEKRWNPLFADYRKALKGDSFTPTSVKSANQQGMTALKAIGVDTTSKAGDDDKLKNQRFFTEYANDLEVFENNKGSKATATERQKLIDTLMVAGEVDGWLWDPDKHVFELEPDELEDFTVDRGEVPPEEAKKIISALTQRGKPITNKSIRDYYTKGLLRGRR